MATYAIKGDEKILVTAENKDSLVGYVFEQGETTELYDIEQEMKSLNADRKNLQDLIELELQAEGDIEAYEAITLKLNELANKRKELKNILNK